MEANKDLRVLVKNEAHLLCPAATLKEHACTRSYTTTKIARNASDEAFAAFQAARDKVTEHRSVH